MIFGGNIHIIMTRTMEHNFSEDFSAKYEDGDKL